MAKKGREIKNDRDLIKKIIEDHQHWLNQDCKGCANMRAYLSGMDFCGASYLYKVNLCFANLEGANLTGAVLYGANLKGANLYGTKLYKADLYKADLSVATLCEANLRWADLRNADLSYANLSKADLCGADLTGADLCGADLSGAKNVPYIPMVCPEEGSFNGWKRCKNDLIVKLEIPEDALRSSATSRKCRCDKAKVLAIYNIDGSKANREIAVSKYEPTFTYKVGEIVTVEDFDENRWDECSHGIHFFMNRQEAIEYCG